MADVTGFFGLVARQFFPNPHAVGLSHAAAEVFQHAFERLGYGVDFVAIAVGNGNRFSGAIEDQVACFSFQVAPWCIHGVATVTGECGEGLVVPVRAGAFPWGNGAFGKCQAVIRDDQIGIKMRFCSNTIAGWACAHWRVEGEQAWLDLFNRKA